MLCCILLYPFLRGSGYEKTTREGKQATGAELCKAPPNGMKIDLEGLGIPNKAQNREASKAIIK
jgi:hypothetical protein